MYFSWCRLVKRVTLVCPLSSRLFTRLRRRTTMTLKKGFISWGCCAAVQQIHIITAWIWTSLWLHIRFYFFGRRPSDDPRICSGSNVVWLYISFYFLGRRPSAVPQCRISAKSNNKTCWTLLTTLCKVLFLGEAAQCWSTYLQRIKCPMTFYNFLPTDRQNEKERKWRGRFRKSRKPENCSLNQRQTGSSYNNNG